ncbi:MAG: hypothetical protein CBC13_07260 [Planctomycetia bacterium TMED53]|nr:MAG: hypothetical protein CBC13_07260 [Planctomycetia bacterium TMED53]
MGSSADIAGNEYEVIVIGAGLAGLATASELVSRGYSSVLVLEQERFAGLHSSGKNAGLVRQAAEDGSTTRLCVRGAELIRRWSDAEKGLHEQTGSLILSAADQVALESWSQVDHRRMTESEVRRLYPQLQDWPGGEARFTPGDGVVDVPRLLGLLIDRIQSGGGQLCFGVTAGSVRIDSPGRFEIEVLRADSGIGSEIDIARCRQIVVANGAWAKEFAESSQLPISLVVTNRGCLLTDVGNFSAGTQPWIWAHTPGWYLRDHEGGLLWSSCEEEVAAAGDCQLAQDLETRWRSITNPYWGDGIGGLKVLRGWIGQRTFIPDRRFLLGEDPRCQGWFWAVGLGGHGVTSSLAVGEEVANSIQGKALSPDWIWAENRIDQHAHGFS